MNFDTLVDVSEIDKKNLHIDVKGKTSHHSLNTYNTTIDTDLHGPFNHMLSANHAEWYTNNRSRTNLGNAIRNGHQINLNNIHTAIAITKVCISHTEDNREETANILERTKANNNQIKNLT